MFYLHTNITLQKTNKALWWKDCRWPKDEYQIGFNKLKCMEFDRIHQGKYIQAMWFNIRTSEIEVWWFIFFQIPPTNSSDLCSIFSQGEEKSMLNLYLYKNTKMSVCLSVQVFLGHFETDWETLWHKLAFWTNVKQGT